MTEKNFSLIVKSTAKPVVDTLVMELEGPEMSYEPGQHLTLLFESGGKKLRRSYSICSLPNEPYPKLAIRSIANGEVSRRLVTELQVGDVLNFLAPSGRFTLQGADEHVFFAAGSGITPIYPLIKHMLQQTEAIARLYYSEKHPERCLFYSELLALAAQYPNRLELHWHFSELVDRTTHLNGRLNQYIVERDFAKKSNNSIQFYLCGPLAYMRMIRISLLYMGYHEDQIKQENFASEGISMAQKQPERAVFEASIRLGNKHFKQLSNQSILQAAMAHQIPLAYSCENGQCGTCTLRLSKGKVFHRINEVLTAKEIEAGYFLSCSALPDAEFIEVD